MSCASRDSCECENEYEIFFRGIGGLGFPVTGERPSHSLEFLKQSHCILLFIISYAIFTHACSPCLLCLFVGRFSPVTSLKNPENGPIFKDFVGRRQGLRLCCYMILRILEKKLEGSVFFGRPFCVSGGVLYFSMTPIF